MFYNLKVNSILHQSSDILDYYDKRLLSNTGLVNTIVPGDSVEQLCHLLQMGWPLLERILKAQSENKTLFTIISCIASAMK